MLLRFMCMLGIVLTTAGIAQGQAGTRSLEPVEMPRSFASMLAIPALNLFTDLTTFYLDGISWEIDPREPLAGHLEGTALPGSGNTVIAGHAEYPDGTSGIFSNLADIENGDLIHVRMNGQSRRFVVVDIRTVDYRDLSVVYPTTYNRLTLITCDLPSYVAAHNLYYARIVIVADEVHP